MAKVENVSMVIGNDQVQNSNQESCRKIKVSAKFKFAPEEIGNQFQARITLFGTDRPGIDVDDARQFPPWIRWDTAIGDFDFSGGNGALSTSALSIVGSVVYQKALTPTTTEMDFVEEKLVLESKLNEDPLREFIPIGPPPITHRIPKPHQDELFVKVQLIAEGISPVQITTIF
ncbi:hypothetical protein DR864_13360 [Runella rosea]|uniref:Uncharacterized protein n=1 Tax=Runella rosea TaxID=2259595 RepID=A0A344TJ49_9BACT|nr:hypothetical protein [Runella rosea]AXE18670.1 hypothetical protein DR864_13360 [Runella rosea]